MRIDLLRGLFLCVFAFLAQGAFAHGLVQDPPSRNWFCGASEKLTGCSGLLVRNQASA